MFFLHPIALGIIGILHPSGVFMLPAGLELRSTALGQHKNAFGAENDPAGKGCNNLPILSIFYLENSVPGFYNANFGNIV